MSLKCRLALEFVVDKILKLGHSSWNGERECCESSCWRPFEYLSSCALMFLQIPVFRTNRNTLCLITLISKVSSNWPLNLLLAFSLKLSSKKFKAYITWSISIPLGKNLDTLVIHISQENRKTLLHRKL